MASPSSHGSRVIGAPIADDDHLEQLAINSLKEGIEAPTYHRGFVVRGDHD